jgi:GNAT superfamily N-acetyltransferase
MSMTPRALELRDLPAILALQRACYRAELQEGAEAFHGKLAAFPAGCLGLEREGRLGGYVFCQPWRLGETLPLDHPGGVPAEPDCLYIHDLAVHPDWRGSGAAAALLARVEALAASLSLDRLALVSVQDSEAFWARQGFRPVRRFAYAPGVPAVYMRRGR